MDTVSNSNGQFTFTGLARGEYSLVATSGLFFQFSPGQRIVRVDGNVTGADFYAGIGVPPASSPPAPVVASGNEPFTLSGRVMTTVGYGLAGVTLTLLLIRPLEDEAEDPEELPEPSGGRGVPIELLSHYQGTQHTTADCWAIMPLYGPPEGYISLDRSLELPEYESAPGDDGSTVVLPAMRYACAHGVSTTAVITRMNLSKAGVDVSVLAFDREKLESGYYKGAQFEAFRINRRGDLSKRDVRIAGVLGNARVGTVTATIELIPYPDLTNRSLGRTCGVLCDVGQLPELPGEEFGTGRCRNQSLQDGPSKDDWTVVAEVTAITDKSVVRFQIGDVALSGAALHADFMQHLEEGTVRFLTTGEGGGANAGTRRTIKTTTLVEGSPGEVEAELHQALTWLPQIGDTVHLTAGCRRTAADCIFYQNYNGPGYNFQGFDQVPGREGLLRRYFG